MTSRADNRWRTHGWWTEILSDGDWELLLGRSSGYVLYHVHKSGTQWRVEDGKCKDCKKPAPKHLVQLHEVLKGL